MNLQKQSSTKKNNEIQTCKTDLSLSFGNQTANSPFSAQITITKSSNYPYIMSALIHIIQANINPNHPDQHSTTTYINRTKIQQFHT